MFNENTSDSWVWIILIFALLFGGFGGGVFGGANSATDGYILTSDFANIERKIDGVNNGICSLGYDQLGQMNGINMNIMQNTNTLMTQLNAMSATNAQCCCENKQAISNAVQTIVNNDNANYRALHDEIVANRVEDLKAQLANQQAEIQSLNLVASQQAQNQYLIGQLRPSPIPAYTVSAPYYYGGTTIS